MNLEHLLTIAQAAARRGCSTSTIWRRIADGELKTHRRFGRTLVCADDVDRLSDPPRGAHAQRAHKDGGDA